MFNSKINIIQDTIHGAILYSQLEKAIISSPIFNRLHNISQNSTAFMTFPSNRTKRFEHSLGTMDIAGKMIFHSFMNANKDDINSFIDSVFDSFIFSDLEGGKEHYEINCEKECIYIKTKYTSEVNNLLNKDFDSNGIFTKFIPNNIPTNQQIKFLFIYEAVRISALLHDLGHPPYSHITETSLTEIYDIIIDDEKGLYSEKNKDDFISIFNVDGCNSEALHENISFLFIKYLFKNILELNKSNQNTYLFYLICFSFSELILRDYQSFKPLHGIISGTLDADRLDYVARDANNSGINGGNLDYDRIVQLMKLINVNGNFAFAPNIKTLNSIEDYLHKRVKIYKNIIFHHRVIKTDYLMGNILKELSLDILKKNEIQDEANTYSLINLWKIPRRFNQNGSDLEILYWDDSWLLTSLKYFYSKEKNDLVDDNIYSQLSELLTNTKKYYSLIKVPSDIYDIDKDFVEEFQSKRKFVTQVFENNEINKTKNSFIEVIKENIDKIYLELHKIESLSTDNYWVRGIPTVLKNLPYLNERNEISTVLSRVAKNVLKKHKKILDDIFIQYKSISIGLKSPIYVYKSKSEVEYTFYKFKKVSNISKTLENEVQISQNIFAYYNPKSKLKLEKEDIKSIKTAIGKTLAALIIKDLTEKIDKYKQLAS
jgi:hypothetical protein